MWGTRQNALRRVEFVSPISVVVLTTHWLFSPIQTFLVSKVSTYATFRNMLPTERRLSIMYPGFICLLFSVLHTTATQYPICLLVRSE